MFQAYWQGKPYPEDVRQAVLLAEAMLEDIFTSDAEEIIEAVELDNEE